MLTEDEKCQEFLEAASQYEEDSIHLEDLYKADANIRQIQTEKHTFKLVPSNLQFHYVITSFRATLDGFLTLLTDWTLPFTHPLHWLYLIFIYPIVLFGFAIFELSLIILHAVRLNNVIDSVYEQWRKHISSQNSFDSEFYEKQVNRTISEDGIDALDKPFYKEDEEIVEKYPDFDLDIAQFLLYVSDLVYARDSDQVSTAKLTMQVIKKTPEKCDELLREIVPLLTESDKAIRAQAKKWRLTYTTLSELNSFGDSFAGIFYSEKHNFIVVAFKGPSPDDFEKWFTDLAFQHEDGRSFIPGDVHKGYRSLLYPENDQFGPYTTIINGIKNTVRHIRETRKHKFINIWVTGHSLGGAMATWFYGRVKKSPEDLGEHCVLRDAYVFGAPRVGDFDFALTYKSSSGKHENVKSTLWRVVDDDDLLAHLPPGYHSPKKVGKHNVLTNYSVGETIKFYQQDNKPKLLKNPICEPEYVPVIKSSRPLDGDKYEFPIYEHDKLLPSFIRNHTTSRYAMALALARNHLREKEGSSGTKGFNGEIVLEREK